MYTAPNIEGRIEDLEYGMPGSGCCVQSDQEIRFRRHSCPPAHREEAQSNATVVAAARTRKRGGAGGADARAEQGKKIRGLNQELE